MSDDTKENTGWTTPTNDPTGWNPDETERLAEFEQGSRERSAATRAQREGRAERVTFTTERDVPDPSRIYTPLERREPPQVSEREASTPEIAGGGDAASIEGKQGQEARQDDIEAAEMDAAENAEIEAAEIADDGAQIEAAGWEAQQGLLDAAEMETAAMDQENAAEQTQVAAAAENDPRQVPPEPELTPEAAEALESIRAARAREREEQEQGLER